MGARRSGREAALQMLFAMESTSQDADTVIGGFWKSFEGDPEGREYANDVVRGVAGAREVLDGHIRAASENWRLERMTRVDRNILRLATYELAHVTDVPKAVILDEAIELAKQFSAEGASAFVNGILVKVAELVGRVEG
jgi:N utilization substance protein B